jgi:hypothetical protein
VVTHGKLPFRTCFKFGRQRLKLKIVQPLTVHLSPPVFVHLLRVRADGFVGQCVSLFLSARDAMPRLRNFDTEPPSSYCYEFQPDHRLETPLTRTPPPICTFVPDSQTALIWRTVNAAND